MTLIGIILAIVGVLGFLANVSGIYVMSGLAGDLRLWGGLVVVGVIVAILTRRARD